MTHPIPWFIVALVSIPEAFLCLFIGFRLFGIKTDVRKMLIAASLNGILAYYLRWLPLAFGIHTAIIVVFLTIISRALISEKFLYLFISVTSGTIITGIIQVITLPLIISVFAIDISDIANNPWLNFILFIPVALIMIVLSAVIAKKNYVLYDFALED